MWDVPGRDSVGYVFARSELNIATFVHKGMVEAGAVSSVDWNDERRVPAAFRRDFRELLRTEPYPRAVEMVRADLDPAVRERLRDVLLAASDPQAQGRCIGFRHFGFPPRRCACSSGWMNETRIDARADGSGMKWLGSGMQARFLLAMGGAMVVVVAILAVLLGRQAAMQGEVRNLSGGVIHELFDRSVRSRGEAMARELSDALANPLYYRDLDQVGALVRGTARQPVVRYVLVFDERGRLVHDGSIEVSGFGQPMTDPLAPKAAGAQALVVQESPKVLDNTMPIMVGNQRIGGVRVGMALDEVQQREQAANATLGERLQQVGSRHLGWLLLMLGLLVVIGVAVIVYVQRTLVAPIRDLAAAAPHRGGRLPGAAGREHPQ